MTKKSSIEHPERVLTRTKLQRPPVAPDILPRARLLSRLDEGRDRLLTLISAPAGYGKSTLASRWVASDDRRSAWLTLDERDADLHTFLSYFVAALRQLFPAATLNTEAILNAGLLPRTELIARSLLNDLHTLPERFMLVLDDYHHIRAGSSPNELITEILALPPSSLHLVIATRRDPPLPVGGLRGRGLVNEIRAADLRFSADEAMEFLSGKLRLPVDRATASLVEAKTEGWATGLRLAGLSLRGREDSQSWARHLSGSTRHIADYLVTEVLSRQNPEVEEALVATSILDRFCAPLCLAVYRGDAVDDRHERPFDARDFIDWLVETNLFVVPLDDTGTWYRYHHLFQEYLQSVLRRRTNVEFIDALHARATAWLADNGLTDEAVQHALAGHDVSAATRLAVEHRYELMNTSQFGRLAGWLRSLPTDAVDRSPLLVSAGAFIGIEQGRDATIYRCVERAKELLAQPPVDGEEHAVLSSEMLALDAFIDMAWGRTEAGRSGAEGALDSLPTDALLIRSLAVFTLGFCHQMSGEANRSAGVIRDALAGTDWPANVHARIHFYDAAVRYTDGDLPGALLSCHNCLRIVREHPFTHTRTFASYLSGAAHYWRNELAEAEADLLDVVNELSAANPSYSANATFILACIELARGRVGQAEAGLDRIEAHLRDNDCATVLAMAEAFRVELALRRHDLAAARRLSRAVDFDLRPPLWFFYVPQLTPIRLLLAEGSEPALSRARERLVEMDNEMRRINRTSVHIDVLVLLALVCQAQGDEGAAVESLRSALELAGRGPWIRNFVDHGAPMAELLRRVVADDRNHGFASQVLVACEEGVGRRPSSPREAASGRPIHTAKTGSLLTRRETEIMSLLDDGLSNQEIADRLFISIDTVKTHLQNIYGKLDARGRVRAVATARQQRLITGG